MTDTDTTTAPPVGDNPDLDQLLHDLFVTALEGGIGYWSTADAYHWCHDDDATSEDLAGFYAIVVDCEADEETAHRIDRDVIYRGLRRFYDGDTSGGAAGPYVFAHMIRLAILKPGDDRIDFDADDADVIVQAGLFGEVVYG
jgi:hypothetical protein